MTDSPDVNQATEIEDELPACFVIMPISDRDGEQGHFGRVYRNIFRPACERAGYRAVRADEVIQTNLIHLDILQKLLDSPMAICDLSGHNPNVLFELGLRQAFDKPVLMVHEEGTARIFDVEALRTITYRKTLDYEAVIEDQANIAAAINATATAPASSVNSLIRLLSISQPAALKPVTEGDEQAGLLQVLMQEVRAIRRDLGRPKVDHADFMNEMAYWDYDAAPNLDMVLFNLHRTIEQMKRIIVDGGIIGSKIVRQGVKLLRQLRREFPERVENYRFYKEEFFTVTPFAYGPGIRQMLDEATHDVDSIKLSLSN